MGNWRGVPDGTVRAFLHQRHQPWTKDAPIPKEQAMLEACLILVLNTHGFGERDLAERWGRSRNFVRAILKAAAEEMTSSEVPGWKVPKRTTGPAGHGSTTVDTNQDVAPSKGTKKVPEGYQEGTRKADRARSICREEESRSDQIPSSPKGVSPQEDKSERQEGKGQETEPGDTPDLARHGSCEAETARRPVPRQPDFRAHEEPDLEVCADPHHLAAVWAEELDASPAALRGGRAGTGHRGQRGRSVGLMPVWPLELLEAGPAEAEMAVRAVAELCRGTATRAPRVLEWAAFFGDRAQMPTAWREALAWKLGEAGEPTLGRQYVKPEKDGAPPRALGGPDPMSLFYTGDS